MILTVQVKQAGQKRLIGNHRIEVDDLPEPTTIQDLLVALVAQQVALLQQKPDAEMIQGLLTKEDITAAVPSGKIGFGSVYNTQKPDVESATATVFQAFEDGLFALFIDDVQYEQLNTTFELHETSVITLIRLVFLAGSYW